MVTSFGRCLLSIACALLLTGSRSSSQGPACGVVCDAVAQTSNGAAAAGDILDSRKARLNPPDVDLLFDQYPVVDTVELDGEIWEGVLTTKPWRAFDGDLVHVFGYSDYARLVDAMDGERDYMPYKAVLENGEEVGLVYFTLAKYHDSSTGPYDELVFTTPASKKMTPFSKPYMVENCRTDDISCISLELFLNDDMQLFIIKMWLSTALPVATGIQFLGINKFLADQLYINQDEIAKPTSGLPFISDDIRFLRSFLRPNMITTTWSMKLVDSATNADMDVQLIEQPIGFFTWLESIANISRLVPPLLMNAASGNIESLLKLTRFPGSLAAAALDPIRRNTFVQPKGVYTKNFGQENPVTVNAIIARGGESLQFVKASKCVQQFIIKGELAALDFRPVACYFMRHAQAILVPIDDAPTSPFT